MRKNSVRKFIHAVLDVFPLLVIPIFAIYSMNHEITGNEIVTSGYEVRNKYDTNEVNSVNDLVVGNIYNFESINIYDAGVPSEFILYILHYDSLVSAGPYNYALDSMNVDEEYNANIDNYLKIHFTSSSQDMYLAFTNGNSNAEMWLYDVDVYFTNVDFYCEDLDSLQSLYNYCLEDGSGFPTKSDFNVLEYVWNDGVVYDDADIMSQFVYVTYNTVDKYFNMGNVFNMTGVYDWFVVNIFGGSAPISIYIVWNIILYEFVMDLLFLLYGLFMWFIDMIEKLMCKPLDSIK